MLLLSYIEDITKSISFKIDQLFCVIELLLIPLYNL